MRATIIITDDDGNKWEHELPLSGSSSASIGNPEPRKKRVKIASRTNKHPEPKGESPRPDFSIPLRPFIKRHARGVAGAKKFTLLVAHLAGGDLNVEVQRGEIERQWNKMTGLMGGTFNAAHSSRAKDNGWVDSPTFGAYKLLPGWESVLSNG